MSQMRVSTMKINKAGQERRALEAQKKGVRLRSGRSSNFPRITVTYAAGSD